MTNKSTAKLIKPTPNEKSNRDKFITKLWNEGKTRADIIGLLTKNKRKTNGGSFEWQHSQLNSILEKLNLLDKKTTKSTPEATTTTSTDISIPEVETVPTIESANVDEANVDVTLDEAPRANITIFRNDKGRLCKEFGIDANGCISKISHGDLFQGYVETKELSLLDLKETIESLANTKAFGLGVRKPEFTHITKLVTADYVKPGESIARTKDKQDGTTGYFEFNDQPAFILFDYDDKQLSPLEVHAKLIEIIPEFAGCGALIVSSSSAGIYKANELPPDEIKSSCHIYMIVERGSFIPDIGKFVEYRAWSNGYGFIKNDVLGKQSKHHLFDKAVFSPERLVFEAPPILKDDLKQVPRVITYIRGGMIQC